MTPREKELILAALRYWQTAIEHGYNEIFMPILRSPEESPTGEEIDELLFRINTGEV